MSQYEVQHYTLCGGWVNCWTDGETNAPSVFNSYQEAKDELDDFFEQEYEAYFNGWIEDMYDRDEYRIVEVNHA